MKPSELREKYDEVIAKKDAIAEAANKEGRAMTSQEKADFQAAHREELALVGQMNLAIAGEKGSLRRLVNEQGFGILLPGGSRESASGNGMVLSTDYPAAFQEYLTSNGRKMEATLWEGSNSAGGFAVPIQVAGEIVPLAPPNMGVRSLATVIPTTSDIKVPRETAVGTAAAKSEGDGTGTNVFTESSPTLDQFTLSAFMAGVLHQASFELLQDVTSMQTFLFNDMALAQAVYEENKFVNGSGTNEPQGLKGHVATGVTGVLIGTDNYGSELITATYDVQALLKESYAANAAWLMTRGTAIALRKAQAAQNLFDPIFTRSGGRDYLHGYPITYSTAVDAIGAGNTPIYFGDFKAGVVIGDRGGAGLNVKVLDQPKATEGIVQFLAYRRTDSRIRRSEAIQPIVLHA